MEAARGMVAPQPAVPGVPAARVGRCDFGGLRTPLPESAPNAARRGIRIYGVRRDDADAADLVRESRVVRPLDVARGDLVRTRSPRATSRGRTTRDSRTRSAASASSRRTPYMRIPRRAAFGADSGRGVRRPPKSHRPTRAAGTPGTAGCGATIPRAASMRTRGPSHHLDAEPGMRSRRMCRIVARTFKVWIAAAGSTFFGHTTEHSPTKVHSHTPDFVFSLARR